MRKSSQTEINEKVKIRRIIQFIRPDHPQMKMHQVVRVVCLKIHLDRFIVFRLKLRL